jgi:uncharacterized RDD family membrane protein YckC
VSVKEAASQLPVSPPVAGSPALYANFPLRINALTIDSLVLIAVSALVILLVGMVERFVAIRIALIVSWWCVLLFYEPILVWRRGGTIGHYRMNLRVVDNQTGGNLSLLRAVIRFWLKVLLGIVSFLSMSFTRRHQAVHDILTDASVQMRDAARAQPHQFTLGRPG